MCQYLQNSLDGLLKLATQHNTQSLLLLRLRQQGVVHGSNTHVTLGQNHLNQVDGALEEGPFLIHLLQFCLLSLHQT